MAFVSLFGNRDELVRTQVIHEGETGTRISASFLICLDSCLFQPVLTLDCGSIVDFAEPWTSRNPVLLMAEIREAHEWVIISGKLANEFLGSSLPRYLAHIVHRNRYLTGGM